MEIIKKHGVLTGIVILVLAAVIVLLFALFSGGDNPDGPTAYSFNYVGGSGDEVTRPEAEQATPSEPGTGSLPLSVPEIPDESESRPGIIDEAGEPDETGTDADNDDSGTNPDSDVPEAESDGDDQEVTDPQTDEEDISFPIAEPDPLDSYIASMTLHEKVCQMIIATPTSLTGENKPKSAGLLMQYSLSAYPVGGLIFDAGNISGGGQLKKYLADVQSFSTTPLFLTLDEEGGRVTRLQGTVGTTPIGPMYDYHDMGAATAYYNAAVIASDIKSYGFNLDLAPVADVWSNPDNTVIGDRAYSTDFTQASELVASAVAGFHSQGIPCCLKHFPGHGDSSEDSHYGAVYIYKSLADIKAEECLPFASGIGAGADCVMMGHLIVSELGDDPALFSRTLIQGVLRGEMGFSGVVMTDSLQMKAMTDSYGVADIAVRSVSAGCDILLMPSDVPYTVKAIEDAVLTGTVSESRIDESVKRILSLKVRYGILQL